MQRSQIQGKILREFSVAKEIPTKAQNESPTMIHSSWSWSRSFRCVLFSAAVAG